MLLIVVIIKTIKCHQKNTLTLELSINKSKLWFFVFSLWLTHNHTELWQTYDTTFQSKPNVIKRNIEETFL